MFYLKQSELSITFWDDNTEVLYLLYLRQGRGTLTVRTSLIHGLLSEQPRSLLWAVGIMSCSIGLMQLKGALKGLLLVWVYSPTADYRRRILHVRADRVDSNLWAAHDILITHLCLFLAMCGHVCCVYAMGKRKCGFWKATAPSSFW